MYFDCKINFLNFLALTRRLRSPWYRDPLIYESDLALKDQIKFDKVGDNCFNK